METWRTDPLWLDVAVFLFLVLVGHVLLGHFEEHKPKWRRVLKVTLALALFVTIGFAAGRPWAWVSIALPAVVGVLIVHGWWLPKHGIDGWTGEPRQKYLELVGARKRRPQRGHAERPPGEGPA